MTLSEYLDGFNIFSYLATRHPELPIPKPTGMDFMLVTGYGQREMFTSIIGANKNHVCDALAAKYGERWEALIRRQAQLQNVNTRRELTETKDLAQDTTRTGSSTDKVSAFNSPNLVDNTGNTSDETGGLTEKETRTLIDEKIDVKSALSLLHIPVQDTIISTVVSDVSSFLTLSTY